MKKTPKEQIAKRLFAKKNSNKPYESKAFLDWADRIVPHYIYCCNGKRWCTHCGEEVDIDFVKDKVVECPKCGAKVTLKASRKQTYKETVFFQELTVDGEFQVFRLYSAEIEAKKHRKSSVNVMRVCDWYLSEDGKDFLFRRKLRAFYYQFKNPFVNYGELEFASKRCNRNMYSGWRIDGVYPRKRIQPWLRRYDLLGNTGGLDMYDVVVAIMTKPHFETIWKKREFKLAEHLIYRGGMNRWPSIKVALRHNYQFEGIGMWLDYLHMLETEGKDLRNPKVICPANLVEAHDEISRAIEAKRRRAREEAERQRLEREKAMVEDMESEANLEYLARMGKVLTLLITKGKISIAPLQSIKDFYEEGTELQHCVFAREYYKKEHSLILGAKVDGKRTETIEIDTRTFAILQCRGEHNQDSQYHDKIYKLVKKNIPAIRRMFA